MKVMHPILQGDSMIPANFDATSGIFDAQIPL